MTRINKMKEAYFTQKKEWRLKYGKFEPSKFKGDVDAELLTDTWKLILSLGEYKNAHRKNIRQRQYQAEYRNKNRDKVRVYHRNWKRKARGTPTEMYKV